MDIKPNTLVVITGQQDFLGRPTWGIVIAQCGIDAYNVGIPRIQLRKGVFQDFVVARESELLVAMETDGVAINPEKAVRYHMPELVAELFKKLRMGNPAAAVIDFQAGDLVVVLGENPQEAAHWGVIRKIMPGGNFMVVVGEKWHHLSKDTAIVPPARVIHIMATDGKIARPRKAFFKNLTQIMIRAFVEMEDFKKKRTRT